MVETLVLGIGNTLCGDDGVGSYVVEELAKHALPPGAQVQDAGLPGWGLPTWLEGWKSVFLIDAVDMALPEGSWRSFRFVDERYLLQEEALSLHQADLACGLALAQELNLLPENLYIYGIQPANRTPGSSLSPVVRACIPELVTQIIQDLGKIE